MYIQVTTEVMSNIYCYFADILEKHIPDTTNKKGRSTTTNSNNKLTVIEAYMSMFMNIEHITQLNILIATIHTVYIHLTPSSPTSTATTQSATTTDGAHRQSHLQQQQQQEQEQQEQQSQDVVIATQGAIRVIECLDRLCIYYSNLFSLLQYSILSSIQTLLTRLAPTNQHSPHTTDINALLSFYINIYDKTQCTITPHVASTRPNDDLNRAQISVLNTLLTAIHTILETIPITLYIHLTHSIIQTLCIHLSQGITQNYDHNITINSLLIIKLCIENDNTTTTTTNIDLDTPKASSSNPKILVKYTALFTNAIIRKLDYIYTTHTTTNTTHTASSIYKNILLLIECINTIIDMHSSDDNDILHIYIKYKVSEKLGTSSRLVEELLTTQYDNMTADSTDEKDDISDTLENVYAFIVYKNEYMRDNNIVFT